LTSYKELSQFDSDRHAAFKTEAIKRLQLAGIPIVAGIGNASTDDIAYRGTKLDSFILDKKLETQKPGQFLLRPPEGPDRPDRLDTYGKRVQEIVNSASCTDPAANPSR
jgi:hypothetical protein